MLSAREIHIKKATLRHWRSQFASHLRGLGVAANATERAVRGESRSAMKDGVYRASLRGDSSFLRARMEAVANDLANGRTRAEPGKQSVLETRTDVMHGWRSVADKLERSGQLELAAKVARFSQALRDPATDRDRIAEGACQIFCVSEPVVS